MNVTVYPGKLSGTVRVPASKSAAHRALIAAALSDGPTRIHISATNRDIEATMACLRELGAGVEAAVGYWRITPVHPLNRRLLLDCGESGSTLRFLLPVTAALGERALFIGRGRLPERPNQPLTDALKAHGAQIDSDLLPLNLSGGLNGGLWELPGNISSQYVTGLLLALPLLPESSEIRLTAPLESAAYVAMTLETLAQFGVAVETTEAGWRIPAGQRYHTPGELTIEGDWSAAAFWLAADALGSAVKLDGLKLDTAQGDRGVIELLGQREIDATHTPDLVPAMAAVAATLPQRTVITGAARLRLKESDRLKSVYDMLTALGGRAEITDDGLIIDGGFPLRGGDVDGANDHRVVMAAAVLATVCGSPVRISDAQAVDKSYPGFFRDFIKLGGRADVEQPGQ